MTTDAEFIQACSKWPMWPYLPIKRNSADECCLLFAGNWQNDNTPRGEIVVYNANLWHLPPTVEEFKATAKYTYISIAALLADGWVVD